MIAIAKPDIQRSASARRALQLTRANTATAFRLLPDDELDEALASPDRADLIVAALFDPATQLLVVRTGDLKTLEIPSAWFRPYPNHARPSFERPRPIDFGHAVALGDHYEAASDGILYEFDPDYRRRAKARQLTLDDTIGGAIRRLRLQRRLAIDAFPDFTCDELARIENSEVTPSPEALEKIARTLGTTASDLQTW